LEKAPEYLSLWVMQVQVLSCKKKEEEAIFIFFLVMIVAG